MAKKENWLDKFARSQDIKMKKEKKINKTASMKKTEKFILAKDQKMKNVKNGDVVKYNGAFCKVVNAEFEDEIGKGVVIEKIGQEYARFNPGNVYDIDAAIAEENAYTTSAKSTAEQIIREDTIDGTKGSNRPMRRRFDKETIVPEQEYDDTADIDVDSYVNDVVDVTEDLLEDTENLVKDSVPAKYVRAILDKVASKLNNEGLNVKFDSKVTREMARKTAGKVSKVTNKDMDEVVHKLSRAIVAEVEDSLAELDDQIGNDIVANCVDEDEVKSVVEKKLDEEGISCKLERKRTASKNYRKTASRKNIAKKGMSLMDSIMHTIKTSR